MKDFNEEIKIKTKEEKKKLSSSLNKIASSVLGDDSYNNDSNGKNGIFIKILKYFKKSTDVSMNDNLEFEDSLESVMSPQGIMYRHVRLEGLWYKNSIGLILAKLKKGEGNIILYPSGLGGYKYYDTKRNKYVKVSKRNMSLFETNGIVFYNSLPLAKLSITSLQKYLFKNLIAKDYLLIILLTLFVTLLGMLMPRLNYLLIERVIPEGSNTILVSLMLFMLSASVTIVIVNTIKKILVNRISLRLGITIEAATMGRILSLPSSFFRKHTQAELSNVIGYMSSLSEMVISISVNGGIVSLFSLLYILQIVKYSPLLVIPAMLVLVLTLFFSVLITILKIKITTKALELRDKESSVSLELITGIQKIKTAGAEKRAFAKWADAYADEAKIRYNPGFVIKYKEAITLLITSVGTIFIYYIAIRSKVSPSEYFAFNSAYLMISVAFNALITRCESISNLRTIFNVVKPVLEELPEVSEKKELVSEINGDIELDSVSFRYENQDHNVIDNLSLKINKGEYVAIVGESGCGKSTLMRLLLGFESPQMGAIYYDFHDMSKLNLKTLRRRIGSVMQNGKLFAGDIYANITISAPWLSLEEAFEVARIAGLENDINKMPMGMRTLISDGQSGISGGQKQRIMIARAIAPKPSVLFLDEATSALDNITQSVVSTSLAKLDCTRIVIAHRLSTIKNCDRIIYLEKGRIKEEGTFDELIKLNGSFKELVKRQQLEE